MKLLREALKCLGALTVDIERKRQESAHALSLKVIMK